jgi:ribosomal protein L37E
MSDATTKKCEYCGEQVMVSAKKCKHCGEILDAQMRDIENLKKNQSPNVFMNSSAASSSSSAVGGGVNSLRSFNHLLHIVLTVLTGGLWLLVYIPLFIFRNKSIYQ